jgi:hypothetical protein
MLWSAELAGAYGGGEGDPRGERDGQHAAGRVLGVAHGKDASGGDLDAVSVVATVAALSPVGTVKNGDLQAVRHVATLAALSPADAAQLQRRHPRAPFSVYTALRLSAGSAKFGDDLGD